VTHHPRRQYPDKPEPTAVEKIATQVTQLRAARHPTITPLEDIEQQLLRRFIDDYSGSPRDAGEAALLLGQMLGDMVAAAQARGGAIPQAVIVNLLRLAGERLYTGQLPADARCPYPLAGNLDCGYVCEASDQAALDARMRSHVSLNHPGETWPPPAAPLELHRLHRRAPAEVYQHLVDHREHTIAKGLPAGVVDFAIQEAAGLLGPAETEPDSAQDLDHTIPATPVGDGAIYGFCVNGHARAVRAHALEPGTHHELYCPTCEDELEDELCDETVDLTIGWPEGLPRMATDAAEPDGEATDD
jgi:hypothetical protein